MLRRLPKVDENVRLEPVGRNVEGNTIARVKRDFVPPLPVGSYIVTVFRVAGYTPDCDGSAMARLENVGFDGEPTGWVGENIGLYEDCVLVVDHPGNLLTFIQK